MKAEELYLKSGDEFKACAVWFCPVCRLVHREKESAERCCKPYLCETCGAECRQYHTKCDNCSQKVAAERLASQIAKAEKLEEWSGPVFWEGMHYNEGYAASVFDMADYIGEQRDDDDEDLDAPEFVFCCREVPIHLYVSDILERETEEWPEDLADRLNGREELQMALDKFCKENEKVAAWEVDYSRMVRLPKWVETKGAGE